MSVPMKPDLLPPPCIERLCVEVATPRVTVAAPIQPAHAIGLVAAPTVLSQTLAYLAGYFDRTEVPHIHSLEVALAREDVCAWADDMKSVATPIAGTRLSMASGVYRDASWHLRFAEGVFADLTVFLADRTVILAPDDGVVPHHLALARLVRNRLSSDWSLAGAAYLHAGCVAIGGRGVVILGDKFSGKTTQICELVSRGAEFTSNDRIFMFPDGAVRGLPVSVNIRPATLARYDSLGAWRGARPANPHRVGMDVPDSDVSLAVGEFASAFGATVNAAVPLHAIIKLTRHGGGSTEAVELRAEDAADLISASVFDGIDYSQPFWNFRHAPRQMIADVVSNHAQLAYEIRVGEGGISACARLIEACVTGVSGAGSEPENYPR
jgi:hypothetical protein